MIPRRNATLIVSLLFLLLHACATPALWKATDPNEYIEISATEISEETLQSKGITFYKNKENGYYYVQKNNLSKLKDYTLRVFGTPLTVVVDATLTVLLVGTLGAIEIMDLDDKKRERKKDRKEIGCNFDENCKSTRNGRYRY